LPSRPVVGSFQVYAREATGRRAGFATGWMYWHFFVIVVAVEAVAGGRILHLYLPMIPLWLLCLAGLPEMMSTRSGEYGL